MYNTIQYLRGIAALMVVLSHVSFKLEVYSYDFLHWFNIGGSGVDLFFIISGFIMCHSIENKKITFSGFMMARARRILPLYWILSIVALITFMYSPSLVNASGGNTNIFSSFTLIPTGDKLLINNGWTLSYEFLFYIIFAVSAALSRSYIFVTSITLIFLFIVGLLFEFSNPQLIFVTSPLLIEFIFGMFAFVVIKNFSFRKSYSTLLIFSSLILLVCLNYYGSFDNILGRSLCSGVPMLLLFIGCVSLEGKINNKNTVLFEIGMSSYSLYLIHPFVLSATTLIFSVLGILSYSAMYFLTMFLMSCLAGWLCFFFVENSISKKLSNKTRKPV